MKSHTLIRFTGAIGLSLAICACDTKDKPTGGTTDQPATVKKVPHDHEHEHGEGPHGGTVIELGKWHGEFCMDHAKKQATVYILDGKVKNPVPIAAEKALLNIIKPQFQVELKADPQSTDPMGKCSRFIAVHDNFAKEQEFEGTVSFMVDGKQYVGDFKEEADSHKKK